MTRQASVFDARVTQGILVVICASLLVAVGSEWLKVRDFMVAGDRCTAIDCEQIRARAAHIELQTQTYQHYAKQQRETMSLELQRLQMQIDRLEAKVFHGNDDMPPLNPYARESRDESNEG